MEYCLFDCAKAYLLINNEVNYGKLFLKHY